MRPMSVRETGRADRRHGRLATADSATELQQVSLKNCLQRRDQRNVLRRQADGDAQE